MDILSSTTERRDKLERNTMYFREKMTSAGFDIKPGVHPIVPIMLYNAKLSQDMAKDLYEKGIYVIGFYYPVVAKGQARIRVQISAGHEMGHLDKAIKAFTEVGEKYGILHKNTDQIIEIRFNRHNPHKGHHEVAFLVSTSCFCYLITTFQQLSFCFTCLFCCSIPCVFSG